MPARDKSRLGHHGARWREPVSWKFRAFVEKRVGGMAERYQQLELLSAENKMGLPRPTLIDLVVSAYIQGLDDAAETLAIKGWNPRNPPEEAECQHE